MLSLSCSSILGWMCTMRVPNIQLFLLIVQLSITNLQSIHELPMGHGDILGKHKISEGHIDIWDVLPTPQQFWDKYASQRRPALFRGAAKQFPAVSLWTDSYLKEQFGSLEVKLEHKFEKKDMPVGERGLGRDTIKSFIDTYQNSNAYIVSQLPDPMAKHVSVLPFVTCGSFYERLLEANLWLSSGGSKSLLHRDADNAFNCLLNGTKDWILIDPKYEDKIPIAQGDEGYGGFSTLNVDKVNLIKYPKFKDVPWQYANVTAGDCLFLPYGYWHQVRSYGSKNLAVSVLFSRLKTFNNSGCDKPLDYKVLADTDMIWTYPGYGRQTLGNPDPFELRDELIGKLKKGLKITPRYLVFLHPSADEGRKDENVEGSEKGLKFGKKIFSMLDADKNGHLDIGDLLSTSIKIWRDVAEEMDVDPANTDHYEHYSFSPDDVKEVVLDAIDKRTDTLSEENFVKLYVKSLGGSERWARTLFNNLKGDYKRMDLPKEMVMERLDKELDVYTKKENKDGSGAFYRKEEAEDVAIMEASLRNTAITNEVEDHVVDGEEETHSQQTLNSTEEESDAPKERPDRIEL